MAIVSLRVGADSQCGEMFGPLFQDLTFEFMPIPDIYNIDDRKYGEAIARRGGALSKYFPKSWGAARHERMSRQSMHVDPEFETFTYGDPTEPKSRPKNGLQNLLPGDLLVFYARLCAHDFECEDALYIVAYFEIEKSLRAKNFRRSPLMKDFGENFHVKNESVFNKQQDTLLLFKGGENSRLLNKACKISQNGKNRSGGRLFVLSEELSKVFGNFPGSGVNSLERSTPRWIGKKYLTTAERFIRKLK